MAIPPDKLREIRERTDIVRLVRDYCPTLVEAGRNFKARCPFHEERTPSFIVSPDRQAFRCYGCGKNGDVFTFLMEIEGISLDAAAVKLAKRAGIDLG